jgi:hypothetical protein
VETVSLFLLYKIKKEGVSQQPLKFRNPEKQMLNIITEIDCNKGQFHNAPFSFIQYIKFENIISKDSYHF